ncbi:hypothetical protein Tco_1174878 [Tanacetum coccineum]
MRMVHLGNFDSCYGTLCAVVSSYKSARVKPLAQAAHEESHDVELERYENLSDVDTVRVKNARGCGECTANSTTALVVIRLKETRWNSMCLEVLVRNKVHASERMIRSEILVAEPVVIGLDRFRLRRLWLNSDRVDLRSRTEESSASELSSKDNIIEVIEADQCISPFVLYSDFESKCRCVMDMGVGVRRRHETSAAVAVSSELCAWSLCDATLRVECRSDLIETGIAEDYIRLEEEKARKRRKVFNWETAKYGKIWYDEDIHDLRPVETEFPAIAFNDGVSSEKTLSCEPTVSSLNDEIDFRISFDDSDDEDYTVVFDKNSFSYKKNSANDLKTDSENDNEKVMPSLPSPKPTVNYLLTEPTLSPQHIDEFNLKDETSLSECDEEEQNVICFNDLFPFNGLVKEISMNIGEESTKSGDLKVLKS